MVTIDDLKSTVVAYLPEIEPDQLSGNFGMSSTQTTFPSPHQIGMPMPVRHASGPYDPSIRIGFRYPTSQSPILLSVKKTRGQGGNIQQLSLFAEDSGIVKAPDVSSISDKRCFSFNSSPAQAEVQPAENSKYPPVPPVVGQAWSLLIPAIVESSWHVRDMGMNLIQNVRHLRSKIRKYVVCDEDAREVDFSPETWVTGLLIAIGTLPLDVRHSPKPKWRDAGREKKLRDVLKLKKIEPCERDEALSCLEILIAKAWYMRHTRGMSSTSIHRAIHQALEFMYWECGVPVELGLYRDESMVFRDADYDEVRAENYQHLYDLESSGHLPELLENIRIGTALMAQYRLNNPRKLARTCRRDARWQQSCGDHLKMIQERYASEDEPVKRRKNTGRRGARKEITPSEVKE